MDDVLPGPKARACPICGKPATAGHAPFCSARCKTIDLGRWLDGRYGIPDEEPSVDDEPDSPGR